MIWKYFTGFTETNQYCLLENKVAPITGDKRECIRFPRGNGKTRGVENCTVLSESRNNGGLRFRREAKPYLFVFRRGEGIRLRACTYGTEVGKAVDEIDNARNCVLRKGPLSCVPSLVSSLYPLFVFRSS